MWGMEGEVNIDVVTLGPGILHFLFEHLDAPDKDFQQLRRQRFHLDMLLRPIHKLTDMGAYLRKMAIDGYIIKVDYTQQKKLAAAVSRAASNINQICRRINSKGNLYEDDVTELKERQKEIWQLLKSSQSEEL